MAIFPISPADLNLPPTESIDFSWALAAANSVGHPDDILTVRSPR